MSTEVVNDENRGVLPVHNQQHVLSESAADIFALDQPTGRPSILRQSQAENLHKNIPKGVKVCFQTPLRDPVTKRIMSPSRVGGMSPLDDCTNALESLTIKSPSTRPIDMLPRAATSFLDDDMPIQSRGGYAIDFDNLDSINPFQSFSKIVLSPPKSITLLSNALTQRVPALPTTSPTSGQVEKVLEKADTALDETLPFNPSVESSLVNVSADGSSSDSTVIIESGAALLMEHSTNDAVSIDVPEAAPGFNEELTDTALLPKGSYLVDFDNLDSMNPFQTGGSKIQKSPLISKRSPAHHPGPSTAEEMSSEGRNDPVSHQQDDVRLTTGKPSMTEVLEFNFNDGCEVKRKPPLKSLSMKRRPLSKTNTTKADSALAEKRNPNIKNESHGPMDASPLRGAYTIDFDQIDDPTFNPFGTKTKMGAGSPPHRPHHETQVKYQESPADNCAHSSPSSAPEKTLVLEPSIEVAEEPEALVLRESHQPCAPVIPESQKLEEVVLPCAPTHGTVCDVTIADDEFVPGSMFMPSSLDGQIDYLEQFGRNTFKESALRKQSLYLKFDPLLKESPSKAAMDTSSAEFALPRPSLAIRMMEAARSEFRQKPLQEPTQLLEDFPPPAACPVFQDPAMLDLLVPTLKQTQRSEDVIVDMLKYTQRDLDAALEKARNQAEDREAELKAQIEMMNLDNQHMVQIVAEFEAVISQITAEHKQKEKLAQAELSKVLQEKQQLVTELGEMESSFSDVVKRLDRRKEVIDGFKKNEETLKHCVQNYLARLQKEEQRYETLKTHAEEKIDQANKQIADVRAKLGVEVSALQVQLKREQLKVQSLEKNLEQKIKEVEDVTKLCDELIAKVQKH